LDDFEKRLLGFSGNPLFGDQGRRKGMHENAFFVFQNSEKGTTILKTSKTRFL
jgi:hypothetical protein